MPRPTLKEVASAAGVSIGTASNAFNKPDRLSGELRTRVLEAAKALGYAGPDPSAGKLRTGRTGALGLLFTDSLAYAFTDQAATVFLRGVARGVHNSNSGLLIVPGSGGTDGDPARVVQGAAVDGFLIYSMPTGDPRTEAALARGLPTVTVDQPRHSGTAFVGIDDKEAAADAARHLRDFGHERVDILAFPNTPTKQPDHPFELSLARIAGYEEGLGPAWDPVRVHISDTTDPSTVAATVNRALDGPEPPTAFLCMADSLAVEALRTARARGLHVPTDLSIIGFDDSPEAAQTNPPLTTIAQPIEEKGRIAAELLLRAVDEGEALDASTRIILPHELISRATTGAAPARPGS